jgi:hypothetical protein
MNYIGLSLVSIIGPLFSSRDIGYLETTINPIPQEIWKSMPVELRQLVYFAKLCGADISFYHSKKTTQNEDEEKGIFHDMVGVIPSDEDIIRLVVKGKRKNIFGFSSLTTASYVAKTGKYVGDSGFPGIPGIIGPIIAS